MAFHNQPITLRVPVDVRGDGSFSFGDALALVRYAASPEEKPRSLTIVAVSRLGVTALPTRGWDLKPIKPDAADQILLLALMGREPKRLDALKGPDRALFEAIVDRSIVELEIALTDPFGKDLKRAKGKKIVQSDKTSLRVRFEPEPSFGKR